MKCKDVNGRLIAYLDGDVTPSEQQEIEAHLVGCPACAEEVAEMRALSHRVGVTLQAVAAAASPPPQAWSRLQGRLTARSRPLAPGGKLDRPFLLRRGWRTALAALALACLLGISISAFYPGGLTALAQEGIARIVRIVRLPAPDVLVERYPALPAAEELVHTFTPLDAAQRQVDFHIYAPEYVPEGLTLLGAEGQGPNSVRLRYEGDGTVRRLDLAQTRLTGEEAEPPFALGLSVSDEQPLLKVMVSGTEALALLSSELAESEDAPVEAQPVAAMVWEHDGFAFYMLVSSWRPGLPVSEAIRIAESLR